MYAADLDALRAWDASGAMALTGRADGPPLGPPAPLIAGVHRLAASLPATSSDPLRHLSDRALASGFSRRGDVSCGGATRLLQSADGWIAVSLAREADIEMVPAWLELDGPSPEPWSAIRSAVRSESSAATVARARLLGLPVSELGEIAPSDEVVKVTAVPRVVTRTRRDRPVVVDLSPLWAGPLCSHLLQTAGAQVIKVEARGRPDGTRRGPHAFFDHLNHGKEVMTLDFGARGDLAVLRRVLANADVVIEGSRPRALEQLGIVATDLLADGPKVWVSITGYGRDAPGRDWVAFGDDAAVAGGLVVWDDDGPCFCADAIADPLTGLTAAASALDALDGDRAVLLDVAMARVAAAYAGPTIAVPVDFDARRPGDR